MALIKLSGFEKILMVMIASSQLNEKMLAIII
jgi:hypothetical protein